MSAIIRQSIIITCLLMAGLAFGCVSPAVRADQAHESVADLKSGVKSVDKQVDATINAMEALGKDANVRGSYEAYAQQLSKMRGEVKHVRELESQIAASRASYFSDWGHIQSQASDEAIRVTNDMAREEILGHYGQAQTAMTQVRMDMDPFLNELQNINTYLEGMPTESQVEDMTPMIQRAKIASRPVKKLLALAISELEILETSLVNAPR